MEASPTDLAELPDRSAAQEAATVKKIQTLLAAKDDTSRFVGLALLKPMLDNSPGLQADQAAIVDLWQGVSPRFLDRLLRTGVSSGSRDGGDDQGQGTKHGADMLDIVISVLHAFLLLLPEETRKESRMVERIPKLLAAVPYASEDSLGKALWILSTLCSYPAGSIVFLRLEDLNPLVELAPTHSDALDVLLAAWTTALTQVQEHEAATAQARRILPSLAVAFKGTDAVTLLSFLDRLIQLLDPATILPSDAGFLPLIINYIQALSYKKPTPAARKAYTNLAATLLHSLPSQVPALLFAGDATSEKPFSYHFLTLLLIDLRATLPTLLPQLNSVSYPETSRRLASVLDILSSFTGYLVQSLDADGPDRAATALPMSSSQLLKLRKAISEAYSDLIEHLRERYDASVAGALGLHPDARTGMTRDGPAARLPLAWDAKGSASALQEGSRGSDGMGMANDAFILAAVRALAVWVRDDDNDALRAEASGLMDLFMDLYRDSTKHSATAGSMVLDFRSAVLVALEGLSVSDDAVEALLSYDGWLVLTTDLLAILHRTPSKLNTPPPAPGDLRRGIEAVRILLPIVEASDPYPPESWLDLVTSVAGWDIWLPDREQTSVAPKAAHLACVEFWIAVLQLVTALVVAANVGMRRRYFHSIGAVVGIADSLKGLKGLRADDVEDLDDIVKTLRSLR
jgi:hypothetical protein